MADDDYFVRITLRIPKPLHEKLNDAAAKKRSMNAEIIARLEFTFSREEARSPEIDIYGLSRQMADAIANAHEGGKPVTITFTIDPKPGS